jgi:serine/threonine protein kinase
MTASSQGNPFPDLSRASLRESRLSAGAADVEGYRILEELPRGGQAIVYKALHEITGVQVALKVLPISLTLSSSARRNFEREVELASSLRHPNIVTIRESGIAKGQYYFAMEYIEGLPLDEFAGSRELSLREKMVILYKICDAMTEAHQHGVIHRDLKPSNILIDSQGEPHIVDFGLAKLAGDVNPQTTSPTLTGELKGTLAYMSPEQATGRPEQVDVRTDVYALGVILYHMLTGRFPYDITGTAFDAMTVIKSADPVRPRALVKRLDSDVEAIVLKALAKDPRERYQSAAEMTHDIRCWLDDRPIVARSVSTWYLLRKTMARHRYTSVVVGLLILIVFGFSCFGLGLYRDDRLAHHEAADLAAKWEAEATSNMALAERVTFTCFLLAYQVGETEEARGMAGFLTQGSRQSKAAAFLLNAGSRPQTEVDCRLALAGEEDWFIQFVLGEHYRRIGRTREAAEAYATSTAGGAKADAWLATLVQSRVRELSSQEPEPSR